jgi:integrase/recombinase XerD
VKQHQSPSQDSQSLSVEDSIERFLRHRQRSVSPQTSELYRRLTHDWLVWRGSQNQAVLIKDITEEELAEYLDYLRYERIPRQHSNNYQQGTKPGLAPASVATVYRVLRAFWRFLGERELITEQQKQFFDRSHISAPHVPAQARPVYDPSIVEQLLTTAAADEDQERSWRNRAIILLLLESGLRVGELCSLRDSQINLENRSASVRRKGGKQGAIFWSDRADSAIRAYLRVRSGPESGPFIRSTLGRRGERVTRDAIRSMLRTLAKRAGVDLPKGAPVHGFRHTFAHDMLDAGGDISQVSQLLGHAHIETTMIYLRERPEKLQKIHSSLSRKRAAATSRNAVAGRVKVRIGRLCRERDITPAALARRIGCSLELAQRYMADTVEQIDVGHLAMLCEILQARPGDLLVFVPAESAEQ